MRIPNKIEIIDSVLTGKTWVPQNSIDEKHIGISGHSFGGWTTIVTTSRDDRIIAALPLAPGGGNSSEKNSEREESEV